MPEGPSIVILKELAEPFIGQTVLEVSGNSKTDIHRILHQKITDIKTWGKHTLICFPGFTLRIHLMLYGSYRINEKKENAAPRLSMKFSNGEWNFYSCSIKFIDGNLNDVYDWTADVMNAQWSAAKARQKLKAVPEMLACDALLDQNIFAGVGNIIKNEVLFRIRVHPESKIGALPAKQLNLLIKEARQYSFDFYEWKKKYELKKHYLVYTKKICPRDGALFIKKKLGKHQRRSFYCDVCQVLYG